MKNKKLLSVLSLGIISSFLASCGNSEVSYVAPKKFTEQLGIEVKAEENSGEIDVRKDEDGQIIILNDPKNDPTSKTITSIKSAVSQKVLFFSSSSKNKFNETFTPEITILPYSAKDSKINWESSNSNVASVDENGKITAIAEGTAIITVSNDDGSVSDDIKIVVNDSNVMASKSAKSASRILEAQGDPSFKVPQPLYVSQRFKTQDTANNKVVATSDDVEEMLLSEDDAYFRITSTGTETLVEGGSPIPSKVDYIFYTNETFDTYCLNTLNKHKLIIDQSHLVKQGKTRFQALCEVLDSFFVAGSSIVTKLPGELTGYDELHSKDYNNHQYIGSLGEYSGEFAYTQLSSGHMTAKQSDEEDIGIPAGSDVLIEDTTRYLWEDNLISFKSINEKLTYSKHGETCTKLYDIIYQYKVNGVECFYPDISTYAAVADIFEF